MDKETRNRNHYLTYIRLNIRILKLVAGGTHTRLPAFTYGVTRGAPVTFLRNMDFADDINANNFGIEISFQDLVINIACMTIRIDYGKEL